MAQGLAQAIAAAQDAAMAPAFHSIRIAQVRRETAASVSISFDIPAELAPAYAFRPGQFLTLRATIDGAERRRSYSICAGPGEPLRIGIRHVPGGVFSTWAQGLAPGDTLSVMTPDGRFGVPGLPLLTPGVPAPPMDTPPRDTPARTIAAFAAGSGITPILSVIRTALAVQPATRVFLFYGNRTTADIMFRDAIEDLKDRYLSRLSVFHVLSREAQELPILHGHLDPDRVRRLLGPVLPASAIDHALVCGPQAMIEDLPPVLRSLGVPADCVHVERFTPATPPSPVTGAAGAPVTDGETRLITVIHDGATTSFPADANEPIIDAAIRAGRDLPWSCRGGMCCTCRARVVDGQVAMAVNYSLEPWELAAGFVLTCQARALTLAVTLDYDAV